MRDGIVRIGSDPLITDPNGSIGFIRDVLEVIKFDVKPFAFTHAITKCVCASVATLGQGPLRSVEVHGSQTGVGLAEIRIDLDRAFQVRNTGQTSLYLSLRLPLGIQLEGFERRSGCLSEGHVEGFYGTKRFT